jgi:ABC-2 type transport system ATP-binding protein
MSENINESLAVSPGTAIVELAELTKKYAGKTALDSITLTIEPGRIVGLLGPNGSGKTTLIKILTGILTDYDGTAKVGGYRPGAESKAMVSYLPDRPYFGKWMRPVDAISLFSDFYTDFDKNKCVDMLGRLGLSPTQRITTMSKGMIDKFQLCLVMSRSARLYVLDEPLGGVDPAARDFILDTVLNNYSENGTILMSTHLIADVERMFDTVIFLKEGKVALYDEIDNIRQQHGKSVDQLFREVFKC